MRGKEIPYAPEHKQQVAWSIEEEPQLVKS